MNAILINLISDGVFTIPIAIGITTWAKRVQRYYFFYTSKTFDPFLENFPAKNTSLSVRTVTSHIFVI